MRKIGLILVCVLAILALFPMAAQADIGPKPSVVIDFKGLAGEDYYATLLSKVESTGPYSVLKSNQGAAHYGESDKDYDVFRKFAEYEDADGFYFIQFFQDCSDTQQFSWTYYPPQEFKILLYFPKTDNFVVSGEAYERYAFDSYFTADVSAGAISGVENIKIEKSYNYGMEILSLVARILLTIAIELVIAILFGFREKRQIRFIALVNVVTQIALNLALNIINYNYGQLAFVFFFILLEIFVFIVEAVIYSSYLKKISAKKIPGWKPGVYALLANIASFALGLGLAYWLPGIF